MRILSFSGFVPEQICDIVRFEGYHGDRNISQYCGYADDFVSQVLYDKTIDGAIFPKSCDSSRIIGSYIKNCGKYVYQLPVPARSDDLGITYFAEILKDFQETLEKSFPEYQADVLNRSLLVNKRNEKIRSFYNELDQYSYFDYLEKIHKMLLLPLSEQADVAEFKLESSKKGKRVYLIGSFLTNLNIVNIIENHGLQIVGDDLPESGRMVSAPTVSDKTDIYKSIAASILQQRKSPTQDEMTPSIAADMKEIHDKEACGVIFVTQKFCEPYNYFYFLLHQELENKHIPSLQIELSDSEDVGKAELQVEAFADLLD